MSAERGGHATSLPRVAFLFLPLNSLFLPPFLHLVCPAQNSFFCSDSCATEWVVGLRHRRGGDAQNDSRQLGPQLANAKSSKACEEIIHLRLIIKWPEIKWNHSWSGHFKASLYPCWVTFGRWLSKAACEASFHWGKWVPYKRTLVYCSTPYFSHFWDVAWHDLWALHTPHLLNWVLHFNDGGACRFWHEAISFSFELWGSWVCLKVIILFCPIVTMGEWGFPHFRVVLTMCWQILVRFMVQWWLRSRRDGHCARARTFQLGNYAELARAVVSPPFSSIRQICAAGCLWGICERNKSFFDKYICLFLPVSLING